jgi:hypothetical protein
VEQLAVCRFLVVLRVRQVEGDSLLEPFRAAEESALRTRSHMPILPIHGVLSGRTTRIANIVIRTCEGVSK